MTYAHISFTQPGIHRWPDAPPRRAYLADNHRHLFTVEVQIQLHHEEREIEFHDLRRLAINGFRMSSQYVADYDDLADFGPKSCETLARELGEYLVMQYPGRNVSVSVLEDGEVGAMWGNF